MTYHRHGLSNESLFIIKKQLDAFVIKKKSIKYIFWQLKKCYKNQHHLQRMPAHRKVATSQTSELVGKAPKTCNSYPDEIFK